MAESLKLRNVDSPLRRSQRENETTAEKADRRPQPGAGWHATEEAPPDVLPPDVPSLDEHPAFLSTRVPESLQRRPARMAERLRERAGVRSQKALATQDVVAVLLLGALRPDNPQDVEALQRLLRTYRARQHAQAAAQLGNNAQKLGYSCKTSHLPCSIMLVMLT